MYAFLRIAIADYYVITGVKMAKLLSVTVSAKKNAREPKIISVKKQSKKASFSITNKELNNTLSIKLLKLGH